MSNSEDRSLDFYSFLCQKFGDEETVRQRRLNVVITDAYQSDEDIASIQSGSKAEGLDLPGSDTDIMAIFKDVTVCETETEAILERNLKSNAIFVMNTLKINPCFARLKVFDSTHLKRSHNKLFMRCIEDSGPDQLLSSHRFKSHALSGTSSSNFHIHGPCIALGSDLDMAFSIKCNKWVSPAQNWLKRPNVWPTVELVNKIESLGVLFVPIGCKGSKSEKTEWRLSFSLAERLLVYSFNHTQLLCYALLKIVLKEILINLKKDIEDVLCSFFIKTAMLWICEETHPSCWRPHNIILCFKECLKKLLYCVQHKTLPHYFLAEVNLLKGKLDEKEISDLIDVMGMLTDDGWECLWLSKTLAGALVCPYTDRSLISMNKCPKGFSRSIANVSNCSIERASGGIQFKGRGSYDLSDQIHYTIAQIIKFNEEELPCSLSSYFVQTTSSSRLYSLFEFWKFMDIGNRRTKTYTKLLYMLLHHAKSLFNRNACLYHFSRSICSSSQQPCFLPFINNKENYRLNQKRLSCLLLGLNTDAVGGWLLLASMFYANKRYIITTDIVNYSLSKCKGNMFYSQRLFKKLERHGKKKGLLEQMTLSAFLKLCILDDVFFYNDSPLIPSELQAHAKTYQSFSIPPIVYGHFLSFLCYHHLNADEMWINSLTSLEHTVNNNFCVGVDIGHKYIGRSISFLCLGIAYDLTNRPSEAQKCFKKAKSLNCEESSYSAITLPKNEYSAFNFIF